MDYRGIKHPRHAGLPARLPVNSNQARLVGSWQLTAHSKYKLCITVNC